MRKEKPTATKKKTMPKKKKPLKNPKLTPLELKKKKKKRDKERTRMRKVKRRRGKKAGKKYWTEDHEKAVATYVKSTDQNVRDKAYREFIYTGFKEIIENIVNTFKFHYLPNLKEMKENCLVTVTQKLDKYDPDRGFKAFSFFSVTIKHWFIIESNRFKKKKKVDLYLDDLKDSYKEYKIVTSNLVMPPCDEKMEREQYVQSFIGDLESWEGRMRVNTNLYTVYVSIVDLFKDLDSLNSTRIDRKAIYEHIQASTGLNSSQIANAIYRLRKKYKSFNKKYHD